MPKKKIMVVDDEENILVLLKSVLTEEGFSVSTAGDGAECLKMLPKEKPDLLLLDLMMPGMTGLDLAKKIRAGKACKNVKIVFLTVVKPNEISPLVMNSLKISDYLTKPFNNDELVGRIKWALSKK